jgi:uncharacterized protein (TIGR03435 family)
MDLEDQLRDEVRHLKAKTSFVWQSVQSGLWIVLALGSVRAWPQSSATISSTTISSTQKLAFDVATVKPSRAGSGHEDWDSEGDWVTIRGYSLRRLIRAAFNLKSDAQIIGGPGWIDGRYFDISAKIGDEQMASFSGGHGDRDEQTAVQTMLQTLLNERFHLEVTSAEKRLPMFALVVSGTRTKLRPDSAGQRSLSIHNGHMVAVATSMHDLAESLTRMREIGDRVVVDQTGLTETYDFALDWTPDRGAGVSAEAANPGLFRALQEQLGLKLKAEEGPVPVIKVLAAELPNFD